MNRVRRNADHGDTLDFIVEWFKHILLSVSSRKKYDREQGGRGGIVDEDDHMNQQRPRQ